MAEFKNGYRVADAEEQEWRKLLNIEVRDAVAGLSPAVAMDVLGNVFAEMAVENDVKRTRFLRVLANVYDAKAADTKVKKPDA